MRRPWRPRLRIRGLLILIAILAVLLAFVREANRPISAADARRIVTDQLGIDLAKDYPGSPKTLEINVMGPGSGKYWQGAGLKPAEADRHWCVEIWFAVGEKTTGKGYFTIATDGTVTGTGLATRTTP